MNTTFKPCKNDSYNEYVKVQLAIYKRLFDIKTDLVNVIKRFDGKTINKRFLDALEKISPTFTSSNHNTQLTEFMFNFRSYSGELSINFRGVAENHALYYDSQFDRDFTIYSDFTIGCSGSIYGKKLTAPSYLRLIDVFYDNIENRANALIDKVENYDVVSAAYKQAYEILKGVKNYSSLCYHATNDEPWMKQLKGVIVI